jgi:hypothetical protein
MRRPAATAVLALALGACGDRRCDTSVPTVDVVVAGGRDAFVSYALSGACRGGGTPADCHELPCDGAPACPCHLAVPIQPDADSGEASVCHIEVASTGAYFVVDVGVVAWSDGCRHVELADSSQATIVVDFAGPP